MPKTRIFAMLLPFEQAVATAWPCEKWHDLTVLVAVSGGADSMALLAALAKLKTSGEGRLLAAHFNHRLRGAESDADAQFVADCCQTLGIPAELGHAPPNSNARNASGGIEAAARQARYEFLTATAARRGARYVAMAHTADDQMETILQRIVRGASLAGLAGIPQTRRLSEATTLIRPLLDVSRAEVLEYLERLGQSFREDSTNAERDFLRNRIRHELLPLLRASYHPAAGESLLRLGKLAEEVREVIAPLSRTLFERAVAMTPHGFRVASAPLSNEPTYLVREALLAAWRERGWPEQAMGYAEWDWLARALRGEWGAVCRDLPGGVEARAEAEGLELKQRVAK